MGYGLPCPTAYSPHEVQIHQAETNILLKYLTDISIYRTSARHQYRY